MTFDTVTQYFPVIESYIRQGIQWLIPLYFYAESFFIRSTENINFNYFCIIYSIVFLVIARYAMRKTAFRPKNRQLKTFKQRIKQNFFNAVFELPFVKSYVYGKFNSQVAKQEKEIIQELGKHWDSKKSHVLPVEGMSEQNLRKRINDWKTKEKKFYMTEKISGAFYTTDQEHFKAVNDFSAIYMYHNPLHLDTFKELMKMQSEILRMTGNLLTQKPENAHGVITSGGSESLVLTIYAHRKYYSERKKPNIVIPVTAHAAFDKGCFYLNVEARKARLTSTYEVDVNHLQSLIDSNTILTVASVPNYPHGIIDPVEKIAKIAKKHNIGCHVDGCLGGFVGTFHSKYKDLYSIDREGITSVSIDHHKFGLAPKGISTIFYKTKELRHCQYFQAPDWIGGLYATPSFPGSRSGFASAGAWYSMTQLTKKQYKYNSEKIVNATIEGATNLRKIEGVQVFGDPCLCVIAFTTREVSTISLSDFLSHKRGWNIAPIHKPNGLHISLTLANYESVVTKLEKDVREGIQHLKKNKEKESAAAVLYGTATKIPTGFLVDEVLRCCVRASLK